MVKKYEGHSPAPWVWVSNEHEIDPRTFKSPGYYNNPTLRDANGVRIAECEEYHTVGNPADAELIADAPKLLARCRDLELALRRLLADNPLPDDLRHVSDVRIAAVDHAREVLAKG